MDNHPLSWPAFRQATLRRMRTLITPALIIGIFWCLHITPIANAGSLSMPHKQSTVEPFTLAWTSEEAVWSFDVAWGDYDGDGDLDLATCDQNIVRLYRNDNGTLNSSAVWHSAELSANRKIAWGDVDNDGDLDLAVGRGGMSTVILENDYGILNLVWFSDEANDTHGIAWGDMNGDGYLDLAVGNYNAPSQIYLNNNGVLNIAASWSAPITDTTTSIAWGDMDGDGDLDLALGNAGQPNRVYLNDGLVTGVPQMTLAWSAAITENTISVAWGDMDNDHDLDLVVGNVSQPSHIYLNSGTVLSTTASWSSPPGDRTNSIALGDYDNDGDLDLATGSDNSPNRLYVNDNGTLSTIAAWSSAESDATESVAWGDVDGDGDLDLAVGNTGHNGQPNRLYHNNGVTLRRQPSWLSGERDGSSVAWGDMDNDGDLDLAIGYQNQPSRAYRNDGLVDGIPQLTLAWSTVITDDLTTSIAWGDYDNDEDLDLVVGNSGQPVRLYASAGGILSATPAWVSQDIYNTNTVAWGDFDNDGDLDLAAGGGTPFINEPARLYRNDNGTLTPVAIWLSDWQDRITSVAWGDVDNDGDLDLAVGTFAYNWLFQNDGRTLTTTPVWWSSEWSQTMEVAWGDYDGDGDLDLAAGSLYQLSRLYRNDGGILTKQAVWASNEIGGATSVAWGDVDGDSDLDLAMGVIGANRLYRNEDGELTPNAVWSSFEGANAADVAWGDVDGDGDLDLAAANSSESPPERLYLNTRDGCTLPGSVPLVRVVRPGPNADLYSSSRIWSGVIPITYTLSHPQGNPVKSIRAWYSPNGGGQWLPAVAASGTLTTNLSTTTLLTRTLSNTTPVTIPDVTTVTSTANLTLTDTIADIDVQLNLTHTFDSDLVITLTAPFSRSVLLVNQRGGSGDNFTNTCFDDEALTSIVSGTAPFTGRYRPEQNLSRFEGFSPKGAWMLSIADVASSNTGMLLSWSMTVTLNSGKVYTYLWDVDSSGVFGQLNNVVFRLQAVPAMITGARNATPGPYLYGAYASQTYPFRVRGTQVQVLSSTLPASNALVYHLPAGQTLGGIPIADSAGQPFHTDDQGYLQGRGRLEQGDQLLALAPVATVANYAGMLTLDGIDDYAIKNSLNSAPITATTVSFWISATQGTGTIFAYAGAEWQITNIHNLIICRSVCVGTGITVTDGMWHHIAATWRSSDGQVILYKDGVAVYTDALAVGTTIPPGDALTLGPGFAGALDSVHFWNVALDAEQIREDSWGSPPSAAAPNVGNWTFDDPEAPGADTSGNANDLMLSGATWSGTYLGGYTVYHTNGTPTPDGVDAFTVQAPGVQEIAVTAAHPLILFDLNVSLEWDAHNDPLYLDQLTVDLQKASIYLYDFTNGQVALGQVTVHQNADYWGYAHIAVQASNRLRPFASIGGLLTDFVTETVTVNGQEHTLTYGPGQIRMGATWNRYGDPAQSAGVDWPLILAHELSHYLLYQYDVYIGLDENGLLIPQDTCTGSAMGDVYDPDNTEFISDTLHWTTVCSQTLAQVTLGRTEWATLHQHYPWLITPTLANDGPSQMPFAFTSVEILPPSTVLDTLEDPTFYLDYVGGAVSSSEAHAFLLRDVDALPAPDPDDFEYVYDLGNPIGGQNRVAARGARPGDRLCVFDRARAQFGCEVITAGDERLALKEDTSWTPLIQITPVNSTTFTLQVSGLTSTTLPLQARLFPEFGTAFTPTALIYDPGMQAYSGTLALAYPSLVGHVQMWVDESATELAPRRETIIGYVIGGNPGPSRVGGIGPSRVGGIGPSRVGGIGPSRVGGIGPSRVGGIGLLQTGEAPVVSPDGQMILYLSDVITLAEGQFYTIQAMAGLPDPPPGRTPVGPAYSLVATGFLTETSALTGSVSIQYLGSDALAAGVDENDLVIYFWDGSVWTALDTILNTTYNMASARGQGTGIYVLMASINLPLYGPGWNNIAYPVRATQAVTQALLSISGYYTTVYGYEADDPNHDPWKVYDVTVPEWVNDLAVLEFGKGYWINVSEAITLYLSNATVLHSSLADIALASPPDTFYGWVLGDATFTPAAGMTVEARIRGAVCGRSVTRLWEGQTVYVVDVHANDGISSNCGNLGDTVTFFINGRPMAPTAVWDNAQLNEVTLTPAFPVYLPLVLRAK